MCSSGMCKLNLFQKGANHTSKIGCKHLHLTAVGEMGSKRRCALFFCTLAPKVQRINMDIRIKIQDGSLMTEILRKPIALKTLLEAHNHCPLSFIGQFAWIRRNSSTKATFEGQFKELTSQ